MRRLGKQLILFSLALLVGVILTACSLAMLAHNSESSSGTSSIKDCSSSCSSHTQPSAIVGLKDDKNNDDKEPTPPLLTWPQGPFSLAALYIPFVAYFFFVNKRKIPLLTGSMRF